MTPADESGYGLVPRERVEARRLAETVKSGWKYEGGLHAEALVALDEIVTRAEQAEAALAGLRSELNRRVAVDVLLHVFGERRLRGARIGAIDSALDAFAAFREQGEAAEPWRCNCIGLTSPRPVVVTRCLTCGAERTEPREQERGGA